MPLNKIKPGSNMYQFLTHTWNPVRGTCIHGCSYCYMHSMWNRFPEMRDLQFVDKELSLSHGSGKFIFIGSSTDIFAESVPFHWIDKAFRHAQNFKNKYFIQTRNTKRLLELAWMFDGDHWNGKKLLQYERFLLCTTFESNINYPEINKNALPPMERLSWLSRLGLASFDKYITMEPILKFDLQETVEAIKWCFPIQVNIGADSGNNNLPEPSGDEIRALITELEKFTKVNQKDNLKRLLK